MTGVKSITIYDPTIAQIEDMGSNFLLKDSDIDKNTRGSAVVSSLQEFNPFVVVDCLDSIIPKMAVDYNVIVITELLFPLETLYEFNEIAREAKKGFILALALGVTGVVFTDFGEGHVIRDSNGDPTISHYIGDITSSNLGIVIFQEYVSS